MSKIFMQAEAMAYIIPAHVPYDTIEVDTNKDEVRFIKDRTVVASMNTDALMTGSVLSIGQLQGELILNFSGS